MTRPPRDHTSSVKKSLAQVTSMCEAINSFQDRPFRFGAGGIPWRFRTSRTRLFEATCPSFLSSPAILHSELIVLLGEILLEELLDLDEKRMCVITGVGIHGRSLC